MKKNIISVLIIICMVFTMIPATAIKADAATYTASQVTSKLKNMANGSSYNGVYKTGKRYGSQDCLKFAKIVFNNTFGHTLNNLNYHGKYYYGNSSNTIKLVGRCYAKNNKYSCSCGGYDPGTSSAKKITKTLNSSNLKALIKTMQPGDLIQGVGVNGDYGYGDGKHQHTAIVYSVNTSKCTVKIYDANGKGDNVIRLRTLSASDLISGNFGHCISVYRSNRLVTGYNHKFSYNANGGTGSISSVTVKDNNTLKITSSVPKKSGYVFKGWAVKRLADNKWYVAGKGWYTYNTISSKGYSVRKYYPGESYVIESTWTKGSAKSNYCFYAQWAKAVNHKFSYDKMGGSGSISSVYVKDNNTLKITATKPVKSGYKFEGWAVKRLADSKWYVVGKGWCSDSTITKNGYTPKIYLSGQSYVIDNSWTKGSTKSNYCFYAKWSPVEALSTLQLATYTSGPSSSVLRGTSVYVKGNVKSNYKISDITIRILNSNNSIIQQGSYKPNAYSADLSKADLGNIYFSKLPAGKYTMQILATDSKTTKVLKNVSFSIVNAKITGYSGPASTVKKGTSVYIKGTIKSYYKMDKISICIYDNNGKCVQIGKYSPNAYSADVSKADLGYIYFSKLARGTYTMKIRAIYGSNATVVKSVSFKIV